MAYKQKSSGLPFKMMGSSPAKQKKSKVDRMIEIEKNMDYSNWENRSDKAKKATKNRSSIQEHQLTLKQLAAQKKKEDATKALSKRVG